MDHYSVPLAFLLAGLVLCVLGYFFRSVVGRKKTGTGLLILGFSSLGVALYGYTIGFS